MNNEANIQHSGCEEFRAKIVAAARERFRQFGFAKTSMQEIAAACGMSAANLYRFYDGKLAIGAAVAAREQQTLFADCDRAVVDAPGVPVAKLIAMFHALIDGTRRQIRSTPLLFELGMTVARERPEIRQRILRETEIRIAGILAEGGESSALASTGARTPSRLILIASAPFVLPWMLQTQPYGNARTAVEPLMNCLASGLLRPKASGARSAREHPATC